MTLFSKKGQFVATFTELSFSSNTPVSNLSKADTTSDAFLVSIAIQIESYQMERRKKSR